MTTEPPLLPNGGGIDIAVALYRHFPNVLTQSLMIQRTFKTTGSSEQSMQDALKMVYDWSILQPERFYDESTGGERHLVHYDFKIEISQTGLGIHDLTLQLYYSAPRPLPFLKRIGLCCLAFCTPGLKCM